MRTTDTIPPSPDRDQIQYSRDQLVHREAQLKHVKSERNIHFAQKEELLAHMRLLNSEAKHWKSGVVSETEHVLVRKTAEAAQRHKKPWTNRFKPNGKKQRLNLGTCVSPPALKHNSSQPVCREANWNTSSYTANERRLQLKAQTLRVSQDATNVIDRSIGSIFHLRCPWILEPLGSRPKCQPSSSAQEAAQGQAEMVQKIQE